MSILREWTKICEPALWLEAVGVLETDNAPMFYFKEYAQEAPVGIFAMSIAGLKILQSALRRISPSQPSHRLNIAGHMMTFDGRILPNEVASLVALERVPFHGKTRIVFRFREPYRHWSFALKSNKHARVFNTFLSMVARRYGRVV